MFKLALLRPWLKSTWGAFVVFCKERWELLAGILIGILGLLALRNKDREKALEKTIESNRELRDQNIKVSENTADKIDAALEDHAQREDQIERDHREKSENLEKREKDLKSQILERESSEPGTIAKEINKLID